MLNKKTMGIKEVYGTNKLQQIYDILDADQVDSIELSDSLQIAYNVSDKLKISLIEEIINNKELMESSVLESIVIAKELQQLAWTIKSSSKKLELLTKLPFFGFCYFHEFNTKDFEILEFIFKNIHKIEIKKDEVFYNLFKQDTFIKYIDYLLVNPANNKSLALIKYLNTCNVYNYEHYILDNLRTMATMNKPEYIKKVFELFPKLARVDHLEIKP